MDLLIKHVLQFFVYTYFVVNNIICYSNKSSTTNVISGGRRIGRQGV